MLIWIFQAVGRRGNGSSSQHDANCCLAIQRRYASSQIASTGCTCVAPLPTSNVAFRKNETTQPLERIKLCHNVSGENDTHWLSLWHYQKGGMNRSS